MRSFSFLLVLIFLFSGTETFSYTFSQTNLKQCCCRAKICKHKSSDRFCHLKKKMEAGHSAPADGAHCEFQINAGGTISGRDRFVYSKPVTKNPSRNGNGTAVLNALGCGSREEHKASPTYSKDFFLKGPFGFQFYFDQDPLYGCSHLSPPVFISQPLENPPKYLLF